MHNDPNFDNRLMRFAEGENDPELQRHLDACPECREALETMRMLARVRETAGDALPELPQALTASLQALMPRIRPDLMPVKQPSIAERIRERAAIILAELVLDSGATPALAGLRGTGDGTRQLAFVSDLADLDLELNPGDGGWSVTGQLGMDTVPDGLAIRFLPAGADPLTDDVEGQRSAAISGEGYFDLTLTPGEWLAAVTMDDATIVFREIVI